MQQAAPQLFATRCPHTGVCSQLVLHAYDCRWWARSWRRRTGGGACSCRPPCHLSCKPWCGPAPTGTHSSGGLMMPAG